MTEAEKVLTTKGLTANDNEATDSTVRNYLRLAEQKILARLYPLGADEQVTVPNRYAMLQCELAARLFFRRGAEGEVSHDENGVNRTYGSVDDDDILKQIVPFAKIG